MEFLNKDNVLTIYLEGRVDSSNAEQIEADVFNILNTESFNSLVLDFEKVQYISSAGLRIMLKVGQNYKETEITNVSSEVYEVFDMTGFTSILKIKKAFRKLDVTGCEIVGKGYTSTVYRLNKDTLVKVLNGGNHILPEIEKEISLAKKAFIYGVPTAISFDIVKVGDQYGVVFEMLDCNSLCELIIKHPENLDSYIQKYAELAKKINSTVALDSGLPYAKENELERLDYIKDRLPVDIYTKMRKLINDLPETNTLIHGDYHVKNIMVENENNYMLIDMYTVAVGHPMFELAAFYCSYIAYPDSDPNNAMEFFGLPNETCKKIYFDTLKYYFAGRSDEEIKKINDKICVLGNMHMLSIVYRYDDNQPERISLALKHLNELLPTIDTLEF